MTDQPTDYGAMSNDELRMEIADRRGYWLNVYGSWFTGSGDDKLPVRTLPDWPKSVDVALALFPEREVDIEMTNGEWLDCPPETKWYWRCYVNPFADNEIMGADEILARAVSSAWLAWNDAQKGEK